MHHDIGRGRREISAASRILVVAAMGWGHTGVAEASKVYVFSATTNTTFHVRRNGVPAQTVTSTGLGSLRFDIPTAPGDRLDFSSSSSQALAPPSLLSAASETPSCVTAKWMASANPAVTGYVFSFGRVSVAHGHASAYEQSLDLSQVTQHSVCALPTGLYYVAVKARTADGLASPYSSERPVLIQTTGALIAAFDATATDEGVRLSWRVVSSETLLGYRLYRSSDGAPELLLADGIDAGARSFVDENVQAGRSYAYVLSAMLADAVEMRSAATAVEVPNLGLALEQNYPNPFNPSTRIPFILEQTGRVVVRVFDVAGSHVATVFDGQLAEGRRSVDWDGRDVRGQTVASGVYIYTLTTESRTLSKKMVMVK